MISNDADKAVFSVKVTNTGKQEGKEVVQPYVAFDHATVDRPVRTLAGFEKVSLHPGRTKHVEITVSKAELCWYDEQSASFRPDTAYTVYVGYNDNDLLEQGIGF